MELKPLGDLRHGCKRQDADLQIRRRISDLSRWSSSVILFGYSTNCLQLYV